MRSLIRNSLLNAGAFGLNALAQLALVPLLVAGYGVAAFGALALVRLLLPAGLLGLLIPGFSSVAVRWSAWLRHQEEEQQRQGAAAAETAAEAARRGRGLALVFLLVAVLGTAVALLLLLPADARLAALLAAPPEETAQVLTLRPWFAACLPLLYLGLMAQGVLAGQGRFALLRLFDVAATLALIALAALAVELELPFLWVLGGFLALQAAKALVFVLAALAWLRRRRRAGAGASGRGALGLLFRELRTLAPSQLVSSGTTMLPPLVVVWVGGAPLLGLYDALRRIPQAIKQLNGMVRTTVLPAAVSFAERPAHRRALAERGSFVVGLAFAPLAVTLGVFAAPLLALWLGPDYAVHAWVFLLFMLELTLQELQGVLSAAARADLRVVRRETVIRTLHLLLLLPGLALLLRPDDLLPAAILMLALGLLARIAAGFVYLPHFRLGPAAWIWSQTRLMALPALVAGGALWASEGLSAAWRLGAVAPAALAVALLLCLLTARGEERVAIRQTWGEIGRLLRRRRSASPA